MTRRQIKAEAKRRVLMAYRIATIAPVRERKRLASLLLSFGTQSLRVMARRSIRQS